MNFDNLMELLNGEQRVRLAIEAARAVPGRTPIPEWDAWADAYLHGQGSFEQWEAAERAALGATIVETPTWLDDKSSLPGPAAAAWVASRAATWAAAPCCAEAVRTAIEAAGLGVRASADDDERQLYEV